jgi:hypothetical protein
MLHFSKFFRKFNSAEGIVARKIKNFEVAVVVPKFWRPTGDCFVFDIKLTISNNELSEKNIPLVDILHLRSSWNTQCFGLLLLFLVDRIIVQSIFQVLFEFSSTLVPHCRLD